MIAKKSDFAFMLVNLNLSLSSIQLINPHTDDVSYFIVTGPMGLGLGMGRGLGLGQVLGLG